MQVETLGEALAAGWRVHARCLGGTLEYTRSAAKCRHQAELNLETLATGVGGLQPAKPLSRGNRLARRRPESHF
jgi:hypothetical protein